MRQVRQVLYRLKREIGTTVVIHDLNTNAYNLSTGAVSRTYTDITVSRALVLTDFERRMLGPRGTSAGASASVPFGLGTHNQGGRVLILDDRDLGGYEPVIEDYCTIHGRDWLFSTIERTSGHDGWLIHLAEKR